MFKSQNCTSNVIFYFTFNLVVIDLLYRAINVSFTQQYELNNERISSITCAY